MDKKDHILTFSITVLTVQQLLLTSVELLFSLRNIAKDVSETMSECQVRSRLMTVLSVSVSFKTAIHLLTTMSLHKHKAGSNREWRLQLTEAQ